MSPNPLNIYTGLNSLRDYHNPDASPPLPLVELPPCLNPFYDNGVRIYAKIMTALPAHNVKALPALNLLRAGIDSSKTDTVIEYSSGSTVISLGILSRVNYGIQDTRAYLSNKTHLTKLRLMQFFGLKV
jgi:cysteine synthase